MAKVKQLHEELSDEEIRRRLDNIEKKLDRGNASTKNFIYYIAC